MIEVCCDGLPGPTHHFSGLSRGNLASLAHAGRTSTPRAAALQCLAKMRRVAALGVAQMFLPPLPRPDLPVLAAAGIDDPIHLPRLVPDDGDLLRAVNACSFMWTANVATVIPAADSGDGRTHLFPANLVATPHRAIEAGARAAMLAAAFADCPDLVVHEPLPATPLFADEGAANHHRCIDEGGRTVHVFVHGRDGNRDGPSRFPARQHRAAGRAIARRARLDPARFVEVRQDPAAIDAGAFHNDVVMVGAGDRILIHRRAWVDQDAALASIAAVIPSLRVVEVDDGELPLGEAVASYLFNAQLLAVDGNWTLLAPIECREGPAFAVVERLLDQGFVDDACFVDLTQSMHGGGGPACLRLRIPLREDQWAAVPRGLVIDDRTVAILEAWIERRYPERCTWDDLADPERAVAALDAVAELPALLDLGPRWPTISAR